MSVILKEGEEDVRRGAVFICDYYGTSHPEMKEGVETWVEQKKTGYQHASRMTKPAYTMGEGYIAICDVGTMSDVFPNDRRGVLKEVAFSGSLIYTIYWGPFAGHPRVHNNNTAQLKSYVHVHVGLCSFPVL